MTYYVDQGPNPHVNYEPSSRGGLVETPQGGKPHAPYVQGNLVREAIERKNPYGQAGERYRTFTQAEKDELIANLVGNLKRCNPDIQERMVGHLLQCDTEYGQRVADGLGLTATDNAVAVAREVAEQAGEFAVERS